MIKNNKQKILTEERVSELIKVRSKTEASKEISKIEKLYTLNSFDGMIANLQEELEEYKTLKEGNLKILEAKNLKELPQLIIKARIAQGISQTDLGKRLDIQAQQIQRYEANDYQTISFDRLLQIAKILGICVRFENTIVIGSGPKFDIPENITEDDIKNAERIIRQKCSLVI
ncbi:helix-turn-helix domain-containing protein [Pedobacter arcticus]|uniref:helix-turn-helix domain-containing protein n=1 Tax=Pedobacter arcticus TaxID=752140 RepID=UPI0003071A55|nr:helix-turn-helix transcriptional regulator [Pedobacter arcticus]